MRPDGVTLEPFFLDSPQGPLFAVLHRPADGRPWHGNVLCCMPFNEEMNRCRAMATALAQQLAPAGWGVMVIDLLGTGDSAGDYSDARWALWLDNLRLARDWLQQRPGGCQALLGIRLGAVLAAELHAQAGDAGVRLVLWQPVIDGKTHLTQFMRVRIAANMDRADLPRETTSTMRQQWALGELVEIAGYALHPELAQAIDTAQLATHGLPAGARLLWLEHAAEADAPLLPATQRLLEQWPGPDVHRTVQQFGGPAFWQVHERVEAPQAVEATARWLLASGAAHA
jgi:exosortase A-associated hydrolase 2